jgi:hypothetical protein
VPEGATKLVLSEYAFPYPEDSRMYEFLSVLQNREVDRLRYFLENEQGALLDLLSVEVGAVANVDPAEGTFPLVVYSGLAGSGAIENYYLFEYLASHGFVVALAHSIGANQVNPAGQASDLEAAARDLELAAALAGELPFADNQKLAFCGNGLGAQAAVIAAMRSARARAVVVANPLSANGVPVEVWQAHPSYSPDRIQVPAILIADGETVDESAKVLESMRYADRTLFRCANPQLRRLSQYDLVMLIAEGENAPAAEVSGAEAYVSLCHAVRGSLENCLKDGDAAEPAAETSPETVQLVSHTAAIKPPPTPAQFVNILRTHGLSTVAELNDQFNFFDPASPLLPENLLNGLAYQSMQTGDIETGWQVIKWATEAYPGSANIWDSFADVSMAKGDSATALMALKKSLEVLPADSLIIPDIRTYIETNTPNRIAELENALN